MAGQIMRLLSLSLLAVGRVACWGLCNDNNPSCGAWAKNGECDGKNKEFMQKECVHSCGNCPLLCRDVEEACADWAKDGQCKSNPGHMLKACPTSCGICKVKCYDKEPEKCGGWARNGECVKVTAVRGRPPRSPRATTPSLILLARRVFAEPRDPVDVPGLVRCVHEHVPRQAERLPAVGGGGRLPEEPRLHDEGVPALVRRVRRGQELGAGGQVREPQPATVSPLGRAGVPGQPRVHALRMPVAVWRVHRRVRRHALGLPAVDGAQGGGCLLQGEHAVRGGLSLASDVSRVMRHLRTTARARATWQAGALRRSAHLRGQAAHSAASTARAFSKCRSTTPTTVRIRASVAWKSREWFLHF